MVIINKYVYLFIILLLFFITSCSIVNQIKPEKPNESLENLEGGEGGDEISNFDDMEQDINHIDINEDKDITTSAKKDGVDKQDFTLMSSKNIDGFNTARDVSIPENVELIEIYDTKIPEEIDTNLLYNKYKIPFDYFLITTDNTRIYKEPSLDSEVLGKAQKYVKVKLIARVKGQYIDKNKRDDWFLLTWMEMGKDVYGYATGDSGEPRKFLFSKMVDALTRLSIEMKTAKYGYISNYKDRNGSPPLINGKGVDRYGIQAYQSAPAYPNLNNKANFRYFPDGMIVFVEDEEDDYFKVRNLEYEGEYWIPKKFISFEENLDRLIKAIIVDTRNQNEGVFERRGNKWFLVSYTLATTGVEEQNRFETPSGFFKVLEKKERFYYLNDTTRELEGYAPYGTRFTAGAYIHGVPVAFQKKDEKRVDPGIEEYLITIGTTPRSHKCVRNYTSHAKFIYDWSDPYDTAVIVIE